MVQCFNIWKYDQRGKCFSFGKTTLGLWRSNFWSEFDIRLNKWAWGGTGIWTWIWVWIGVRWLQSWSNCRFYGKIGHKHKSNSFESWITRFTSNWIKFFLWIKSTSRSPQVHVLGGERSSSSDHHFSLSWETRRGSSCHVQGQQRSHWMDNGWHQRT